MGATNSYDIYYLANPYKKLIQEGKVGTKELDEKVRNVLRLILRTSMNPNKGFGSLHSDEHYAAARQIATEGIVLLKNQAPNPTFPPEGEGEKPKNRDITYHSPAGGDGGGYHPRSRRERYPSSHCRWRVVVAEGATRDLALTGYHRARC